MIYVLGHDKVTGRVYEFEPKRDPQCVVCRSANYRVNQGSLKDFQHKIDCEHYSSRIEFNIELLDVLIKEYCK